METLSPQMIKQIVAEIQEPAESSRRAFHKRRHDIYTDGGKKFLIEQIRREFTEDAVREMRLCPINVLKKIINKKSAVYTRSPIRRAENPADQMLIDYYVEELCFDAKMQKLNRYYNLFSNTVAYVFPKGNELEFCVIPPYLYSVVADKIDPTEIKCFIFNRFAEEGRLLESPDLSSATGYDGFSRDQFIKTEKDLVASNEYDPTESRQFIFWTDYEHFTTDEAGSKIVFDNTQGPEQFLNPIGMCPVVNVAKDRDYEPWAKQGEDMVDIALAIQMGWTDLLTIAKHQGFSILTIVSPEEPKKLTIGINRAVWLKQQEGQGTPSISYVTGDARISEIKDNLMDLLGLLLTTNDMPPGSVSGMMQAKNFTSGFQALIESADILQALEEDKPKMRDTEKEIWERVSAWHNYMFDLGILEPEAMTLGKFSDEFEVSIHYADMKPIESEQEKIQTVQSLTSLGLITKRDALKKLYPDLTDDQIDQKMLEIAQEQQLRQAAALSMFDAKSNQTGDSSNGKSNEAQGQEKSKEIMMMNEGQANGQDES